MDISIYTYPHTPLHMHTGKITYMHRDTNERIIYAYKYS